MPFVKRALLESDETVRSHRRGERHVRVNMRVAPSINQNAYTSALPNFRNLGILLRILLVVNMCGIGAAIVGAPTLVDAWPELLSISALLQPLIIVALLALVALNPLLHRLPYFLGVAAVALIVLVLIGA